MENKVYYGEFTLKYWIELILQQEITMPDYQRRFVWSEEQVKKLINSLKNKEFIPPVTIGSCLKDGNSYNYIIDGQQRLTAILLAKIGYFPDIQKWEKVVENKLENAIDYEDDKDDKDDNIDNGIDISEGIKWHFPKLFTGQVRRDLETIKNKCRETDKYKLFKLELDDDFFSSTYLGFSYVVPKDNDEVKQHRYYSTIFRNINFQGTELQAEESREALYFWNKQRTFWFKPNFAQEIKGHTIKGDTYMDFVRYISILSQYHKEGKKTSNVCRGTRFNYEDYFEQYIYSVAQDKSDDKFGKFSILFTSDEYAKNILSDVSKCINNLGWQNEKYDTIIKMDIYFFGLFYNLMFEKRGIDITRKNELKNALDMKWNAYEEKHKRSPKAKKYLRQRLMDSISIYEQYLLKD